MAKLQKEEFLRKKFNLGKVIENLKKLVRSVTF